MSDVSICFPLTERARLLRIETASLAEKARTVRLDSAALLSAAMIVFGKTVPTAETHGIPEEWVPYFNQKVVEKLAILTNC